MPQFANYANLSAEQAHTLVALSAHLETLEEVVRFGLELKPPRAILDVIVQDEYCHDVVLEWEFGKFLVFDTT